jgi:hypothetical protein
VLEVAKWEVPETGVLVVADMCLGVRSLALAAVGRERRDPRVLGELEDRGANRVSQLVADGVAQSVLAALRNLDVGIGLVGQHALEAMAVQRIPARPDVPAPRPRSGRHLPARSELTQPRN